MKDVICRQLLVKFFLNRIHNKYSTKGSKHGNSWPSEYDYIYIYIYIKASVPSWCISHLRYYNGDLISLIRICEISHSTNIKIGYVNISQTLLDSREHFLTLCSTVLGTVLPKHCRTFSKLSNHDIWWDLSHPGAQRPLFVAVKSQFQTKVLLLLPMCSHFQTEFRCSS